MWQWNVCILKSLLQRKHNCMMIWMVWMQGIWNITHQCEQSSLQLPVYGYKLKSNFNKVNNVCSMLSF